MTAAEFLAARKSHRLSQAQWGAVLHIHRKSVSDIESGRYPIGETLAELVRAIEAGYRPDGWPGS